MAIVTTTALAADAPCTFKNSSQTEITQLISGDVYVYAPEGITAGGSSSNVFSTADVKMLKNDGSGDAEADGSSAVASKAVDGKASSMARAKDATWNLELDLKEEKQFDNISVTFGSKFYPQHYRIETAAEDKVWTVIAEDEENSAGGKYTFEFEKTSIRYVRIIKLSGEKKMGICEVEGYIKGETTAILAAGLYSKSLDKMYSFDTKEMITDMPQDEAYVTVNVDAELTGLPAEIPVQENILKGSAVRFVSNTSGNVLQPSGTEEQSGANLAIDGDMLTRAVAGGEWAYTFEADMGEVKEISQVVIYFYEGSYPVSYDVLISEDGEEWTTVGGEENNAESGKREFSFEAALAQYVRIRDNVPQTNVRQMGIAEIEAYEKSYDSDYEIRAFLLDKKGKTPYDKNVYRLNDKKTSYNENIIAENTADINIDKEITVAWVSGETDKSLAISVKKGEESIYFNVLTSEEAKIGTLTLTADELEDGDTVTVTFAGCTDFETELLYDTEAILYGMFIEEFETSEEADVLDVIEKYSENINSENLSNISELDEKELASLKSALLNGEFSSFDDIAGIIDTTYAEIMEEREDEEEDSYSGGGFGGSSGGGGGGGGISVSARLPVAEVVPVTVPQSENTYDFEKPEPAFEDLESVSWAAESINTLYKKGVINGTNDNAFSPDLNVTRSQFVKMLVLAFNAMDENAECSFDDVSGDGWAYPYIASAYKSGLVNGISENCFGTDENITRQDAAVMLYRFLKAYGSIEIKGEPTEFADKTDIADYAFEAVDFMSANGIMNGVGAGKFEPKGVCTRAMAAKIICMAAYGEGN